MSAISKIREQEERYRELNKALMKFNDSWCGFGMDNGYLDALIEVLEESMHDKGETIQWWLWELPSLLRIKNNENNVATVTWTDSNGEKQERDLTTVESLYDYLVEFYDQ